MPSWLVRHYALIGAVGAGLVAVAAYELFRIGVDVGELRGEAAESARLASEALGG